MWGESAHSLKGSIVLQPVRIDRVDSDDISLGDLGIQLREGLVSVVNCEGGGCIDAVFEFGHIY